jgi:hypothetical protein
LFVQPAIGIFSIYRFFKNQFPQVARGHCGSTYIVVLQLRKQRLD